MPRRKPAYEILIPRAVQLEVDKLAGKRAGFAEAVEQLKLDPCNLGAPDGVVKSYRLSGPLQPIVCGVHLRNGYRLAYTTHDDPDATGGRRVIILYVGKKVDPAYERGNDMWDVVHDLFGTDNPLVAHLKPPCCQGDWPEIDDDALDEFTSRLRQVQDRR